MGFANYSDAIFNSEYLNITKFTFVFNVLVTVFTGARAFAGSQGRYAVICGGWTYKTLLMSVYAIALPVTGLVGMMFFDQHIGLFVKMAVLSAGA